MLVDVLQLVKGGMDPSHPLFQHPPPWKLTEVGVVHIIVWCVRKWHKREAVKPGMLMVVDECSERDVGLPREKNARQQLTSVHRLNRGETVDASGRPDWQGFRVPKQSSLDCGRFCDQTSEY